MTKYYKQNSDFIPFHASSTSSIRPEPTPQRIPQQLTILYSLPLNKTSGALFRKKQYLIRKLYLPDDPLTTPRLIRIITRPKKSYITKLDTDANKSFKFLKITKDLKSLRKITFTAYTKNPDKITLKVWRGFNSAHITSMSIGYPYLADPSVLFRIISYHRHLKELIYERLFSQLVSSDSKRCHFNIKRYLNLWETRFPEMLQSFRTYMSLISPQNIEPLTLKLTRLSTLELESNNEVEDTSLTRLVSQLHNIPALSSVSLVFADCYSQQFLLALFNSLASINNLHDLTILLPLCISQPAKSPFPLHNNFAQLQVLNLAISRTHRGHEHFDCEETLYFYEFFKDLHLPRLRKLRLHLESTLITKQRQGYDELAIFLQFLGTLAHTLELLNIRFWGPSLEYYHWERVTNTISTLEKLENLELSEVSYFNNFCVGLLAKMVSKLPKLRDLRLRPVNMTKLRYLKLFVDVIESHGAIEVLYFMVSRLSVDYTKRLLAKLKEFRLRTNFGREKQDFQELFENAGRKSIMKSVLYQCAPW